MSLSDLNTALNAFGNAVANKTTRKVSAAALADNALLLNNQSDTQLVSSANTHADAHINNTANPHGVTATQAGTYDKTTLDGLLAQCVPSGILPMTRIGVLGATSLNPVVDSSGHTVTFPAAIPAFIAGSLYAPGAATLAYTVNATTFYYLKLSAGVASWIASATALPESNTQCYVGKIVSDASGNVTSNTIAPVTRLDTYRISTTAAGSAIPVSGGTPDAAGALLWK